VGRVVTGRVCELHPFGAFVRLEPEVFALLLVSEMAGTVRDPSDVLAVGDEVTARVLMVNREANRVTLSTKGRTGKADGTIDSLGGG
jgi:ribosomal protein S1